MFEVIGKAEEFDEFDFDNQTWYHTYSWTIEQEKEFECWFTKKMKTKAFKKTFGWNCQPQAFTLMWGWKLDIKSPNEIKKQKLEKL